MFLGLLAEVTCGVFSWPAFGALFLMMVTSSQSPSAISAPAVQQQLVYTHTHVLYMLLTSIFTSTKH